MEGSISERLKGGKDKISPGLPGAACQPTRVLELPKSMASVPWLKAKTFLNAETIAESAAIHTLRGSH